MQGKVFFFLWNQRPHGKILADLEEKTPETFAHKVLFQALHY